jgi:hypothetical protein
MAAIWLWIDSMKKAFSSNYTAVAPNIKGADMNPIENVWAEMVRDMDCQHGKEADLWDSVTTIWNNLSN